MRGDIYRCSWEPKPNPAWIGNMEAALLNLLGLAIAHVALVRNGRRMASPTLSAQDVITACIKKQPTAVAALISRTLAEFWADITGRGMPRDHLQVHIETVADLIKSANICASTCAECADKGHQDNSVNEALMLSHGIIAGDDLPTADRGTSLEVAQVTLQSLFGALLSTGSDLAACLNVATSAVAAAPASNETARRSLQKLQQQLASDTGIPMPLLDASINAQDQLGSPLKATTASLVDRAVMALELLTDLMHLSDRAGDDDALESEMVRIAQLVREGALGNAGCDLAALSRRLEGSGEDNRYMAVDLTGIAFVPMLLTVRARLASLDGDPREAARLFEQAAQTWPREDRIRRWQLKIAQARQLAELGQLPKARIAVLCEAAQVYAAAGGLICECDCPLQWAEANLELGMLLLQLGNRECRSERYLAAALHFKPAIEVFTREKAMDGWARSQIGLAHALRGQASFQGDVTVAREAAFAYRAALGILTEDGTPELWHHARCALGDTLVLIAEETGEIDSLQMAIDQLIPYSDHDSEELGEPAHSIGNIAMGRAMLFLAESESSPSSEAIGYGADDVRVLSEAIALIETTLERGREYLTALECARSQRALGRAQGLLFERARDVQMLDAAIASLTRACDLYEILENAVASNELALEIAALEEIKCATPDGPEGSSISADALAQDSTAALQLSDHFRTG